MPQPDQLHIEPVGGVAGDMLLAALLDLGADPEPIERMLASLDVQGVELRVETVEVGNERAITVHSIATAPEPPYRHLSEIVALIRRLDLARPARARALRIFGLLADAEAEVHGGAAEDVHLHEVGQLDSILDVVGIAVALHDLGDPEVSSAPLPSGQGSVTTHHGVLDVPVPAVRRIAERAAVPLVTVGVEGETVTPTGIAVVAEAAQRFGGRPGAVPVAVGVGAGNRRFSDRPNIVRVYGYGGGT